MKSKLSSSLNESPCCEQGCGCRQQNNEPVKDIQKESKGCDCVDDCQCESSINHLNIDFLYLDLSGCKRCQHTESTLEKSIVSVSKMLESAQYEVKLNKIHIDSIDKAIEYKFLSSPTIRLNGKDIISNVIESNCQDCGDLCGEEIDCRDWIFEGVRYSEPPETMIMRAILREIYLPSDSRQDEPYVLPLNISNFFKNAR